MSRHAQDLPPTTPEQQRRMAAADRWWATQGAKPQAPPDPHWAKEQRPTA